jgi:hypothetical protein
MSRIAVVGPLAALAVVVTAVTLVEGAPDRLPAVALGSDVLLHVERAAAMFAIVVAVAAVLREGWRGRLPTQVTTSGLAYEGDAAEEAKAAVEHLQDQVDDLQAQLWELAEATISGSEQRG